MLNIPDISITFEVLKLDKSKYSNSEHELNIALILFTLVVFKFSIPLISFNLLHSLNIYDIFTIIDVLKFDKSKYSISQH